VLDETDVQAGYRLPGAFIETLEKEAAVIPENPGLQDQDIGDGGRDNVHGCRYSVAFVNGFVVAKRAGCRNTIFDAKFRSHWIYF
jgi:hypothetical protein